MRIAICAAREEGDELVPLPSIEIIGGSTLLPETLSAVLDHITADLATVKDSIDGIYFAQYVKDHGLIDATFFHGISAKKRTGFCQSFPDVLTPPGAPAASIRPYAHP